MFNQEAKQEVEIDYEYSLYQKCKELSKNLKKILRTILCSNIDIHPDFSFSMLVAKAHAELFFSEYEKKKAEQAVRRSLDDLIRLSADRVEKKIQFFRSEKDAVRAWKKEPVAERNIIESQPRGR